MGKHHHRHAYIARTFAALTAVVKRHTDRFDLQRPHRVITDTHIHTGRYIYQLKLKPRRTKGKDTHTAERKFNCPRLQTNVEAAHFSWLLCSCSLFQLHLCVCETSVSQYVNHIDKNI